MYMVHMYEALGCCDFARKSSAGLVPVNFRDRRIVGTII
jgi:hypothetical protein